MRYIVLHIVDFITTEEDEWNVYKPFSEYFGDKESAKRFADSKEEYTIVCKAINYLPNNIDKLPMDEPKVYNWIHACD